MHWTTCDRSSIKALVDATTGRTVGYEALARVRDRHGEILGPAAFMGGAEGTSLMWELDRTAFESSCQAAALFARVIPHRPPFVSCNFWPVSVKDPDFVSFLDAAVTAAQIDPALISIELTESAAFGVRESGSVANAVHSH